MSARAPLTSLPIRRPEAVAPPLQAASSSDLPVDFCWAPAATFRVRVLSLWPYSKCLNSLAGPRPTWESVPIAQLPFLF